MGKVGCTEAFLGGPPYTVSKQKCIKNLYFSVNWAKFSSFLDTYGGPIYKICLVARASVGVKATFESRNFMDLNLTFDNMIFFHSG